MLVFPPHGPPVKITCMFKPYKRITKEQIGAWYKYHEDDRAKQSSSILFPQSISFQTLNRTGAAA